MYDWNPAYDRSQSEGHLVGDTSPSAGVQGSASDTTVSHHEALPQGKEYDERGRIVTVGKPRSENYYQLDLAALDLDVGTKKKSSGLSMKIGTFAKGIANSVKPKRSSSSMSLENVSDEEDAVDQSGWPTATRVRLVWPELVTTAVPEDNLKMIDQAVLKDGFHIEFGDPAVTALPTELSLDHRGEYVSYYKEGLYGVDHANYVAYDDDADLYWVVSIEEKPKGKKQEQLRALIRNRKEYVRLNIDVSSLSTSFTDSFSSRAVSVKMAALAKLMPELDKLKWVRVKNPDLNDELASMEEKEVALGSNYKFGVLYVRPGQTEDEIFANNDPKPEFEEWLEMMGTKIELFGWDKYRGGLDVKNRSTGEHSVYHEIHGVSVMFHVCTMLPSQENDVQRVERKRHIGNDVVTFVYLEEGCEPYLATKLTSQFIHIHYVVQKVPGTGIGTDVPASYRIAVVTKYGVEPHAPSLAHPAVFPKSPALRDFLITKAINSERTAMLATEFRSKMLRARKDFLKHLYETYSSNKKKARASSSAKHE